MSDETARQARRFASGPLLICGTALLLGVIAMVAAQFFIAQQELKETIRMVGSMLVLAALFAGLFAWIVLQFNKSPRSK